MDYSPSIFQFDQNKDHQELFQILSNNFPFKPDLDDHNQIRFEEDLRNHNHHHQTHPLAPSQEGSDELANKRRRPSSSSSSTAFEKKPFGQETNSIEKKRKNVTHREIERQRRQEMAELHSSLRSLIPLQNLKGNRSISDQMHVATNYIKELQTKNQELSDKRDKLKRLSNNSSSSSTKDNNIIIERDQECSKRHDNDDDNNNTNSESLIIISVNHSMTGIEVIVNTALELGLSLSKIIQVLVKEGLEVVSCNSVKVKDRFLHTIESEGVGGERHFNLSQLEQKLKSMI